MQLWFGLALLCLGGDAPSESAAETEKVEAPAAAVEVPAVAAPPAGSGEPSFLARHAPPTVEGPGIRVPEPLTRAYVDAGYAQTDDLSGLPFIAGSAHNYRFALGGTYAWHRFSFDGELAFSNITTIDVTMVPPAGMMPIDLDKHQTATSLGDLRLGVNWTQHLDDAGDIVGGFGLRLRAPTHTVVFQFHLADMQTLGRYVFPYYFHIEPTAILGAKAGPFGFVVNQGILLMTGPDGDFNNLHIIVPNLFFWSAHYAVVFAPIDAVGLSADVATDVQMNHIDIEDFKKVNGVVAVALNVGLQVHVGQVRVDVIGRRGLTKDTDLWGVLQYAGSTSLTLRLGLEWP